MNSFKLKSYAKINLALNVTGKKSKLHNIESLISFINLHDSIMLRESKTKQHKIIFFGKFSKNISKINTISKLLKILDDKKLLNNKKFEIRVIKNIPQKAGMGGGSMNAASLLNFFIEKKMIKLKKNELKKISNEVGSDVILGINPSSTILLSNGDIKKYKNKIKFHILVTKPNFGCSTKYIYSKVNSFSKPQFNPPKQKLFDAKYLKCLDNDLEKVALNKYPELKKIKSYLSGLSNALFVRMSGSGSSIVAYFHSKKACKKAFSQYKRKFNSHWCIESKTI
ncbi:4-diphosphocytidyl-2-C-methyl-D-erythritol kinase [Candidatus Pelagibacter ubique]|uniref:4-diphosphocytidyl-2-C-methyl-D-erythritol kinase n=1 Tax=Pelagibacter ubique TaxID=198252 RepID=A0ABX1T0A4_PELUQ|nr:4-(cytidine 5'-diphospho)-2-C-methyl-D-erythritol kinase [Candidatus Pelagibacter ubique]NMN67537.1 4-diphosphocytidyl-2-C-methyl-D-erythritol kinase [Candidatus Pelagibacter ubique]